MGEFDLIARYFTWPSPRATLGVGDDCALLQVQPGMQLAISSDMLVSNRHFFPDVDPFTLGHKALAVNLSDLAACGAAPLAFTLALALPEAQPDWLERFSAGTRALAERFDCNLIGGDTTRGPLTISITVFGQVPQHRALLRSGAQPGDDIYVSGVLGEAAIGLRALQNALPAAHGLAVEQLKKARSRLEMPTPRVALGLALQGIASAAADISDGLSGDLGHILKRSGVGASIQLDAFPAPLSEPASHWLTEVLAGGDDYELVFTAAPNQRESVAAAAQTSQTVVSRVGRIESQAGLRILQSDGNPIDRRFNAFNHFPEPSSTSRDV